MASPSLLKMPFWENYSGGQIEPSLLRFKIFFKNKINVDFIFP